MGEVYKARDTRLDRTVAIKVLPADGANDSDLRARFEREARAIAALDHPHICAVYDVGEHEGTHYLVMQHLDGETLADRLGRSRDRPLALQDALKIAIEIADALDKAHRAGLTHRDVKPANIFLVRSGASAAPDAKLLDFGLAKLRGPAAPISMSGMTRLATPAPNTAHGTILGTVHYMAPEQLEGKEADARSDIWALGAVLYEMATGKRPFDGTSPASIIGSILKDQPGPVSALQPVAPPALDVVVRRCLEKDPADRWQTAHDLRFGLEDVRDASPFAHSDAPTRSRVRSAPALAAVALVAAGCGALAAWFGARTLTRSPDPILEQVARVTHETGFSDWPTWSRDGTLFAFSSNRSGNFEIYVRRVEGGQEVNVSAHAASDAQPAFSPDGTSIAFVSARSSKNAIVKISTLVGLDTRTYGGDIWVAPALGGQTRRLAEDGNFPAWHPEGRKIAYVTGQENHRAIVEVSTEGGPPTMLLPTSASSWEIVRVAYSPDRHWISFETNDRQVFLMPAAGGRPTQLLIGASHVWDPSGPRMYYVNQRAAGGTRIEAVALQERNGSLMVAHQMLVGVSIGALQQLAIAADGKRLLASSVDESVNLSRLPLAPGGADTAGPEEALSSGQARDRYPVVSPDGRRIAVASNRIGEEELWLVDVAGGRWELVQMPANSEGLITEACWAPDGQHLGVMRFLRNGTSAYWYIATDGSSAEQLLPPAPAASGNFACAFSADGKRMVYPRLVGGFSQLYVLDWPSRQSRLLTQSPSDKYEAMFSPDGAWVAFTANTGGSNNVWRIPAAGGQEQSLTSGVERKRHAFYSADGRWLYVQPNHRNIYRMPAAGGALQQVTHFEEKDLFIEEPTISPDGRYLAYSRGHGGSSLWMLTIGQAGR